MKTLVRTLALSGVLMLSACGGGGTNSDPGSSSGGSTGGTAGTTTGGTTTGGTTTGGTTTGGSTSGGSTTGSTTSGTTTGSTTGGTTGSSSGGTTGGSTTGSSTGGSTGGTTTGGTTGSTPPGPMGTVGAARLLAQGTFGPTLNTINAAASQTYDQWFASQVAMPTSLILPSIPNKDVQWWPYWWLHAVTGPDQLRQRVAFALSEIFVISNQSAQISSNNRTLAAWYDLLSSNALGNFRTLLERATLSPAMGVYLNMFRSDKENPALGTHADQNYARESMQLFTIGLVRLNLDGSVQLDGSGKPLRTFVFSDVQNLANVFTGWASKPVPPNSGENSWLYDADNVNAMVAYENHHDTSAKTLVGGVAIPAGGTAASDLRIALDALYNHPNVGPFIGRQLILKLVTSNPSPAYVTRVSRVFNNNGSGVRGDLLAVVKAILTDPEAIASGDNTYGKLREPILRLTHLWRAFDAVDSSGGFNDYGVIYNTFALTGEQPLNSPTVFNFFQPDYVRAGALSFAGLIAPEFQITNENTLVLSNNQFQTQAYQFIDGSGVRHGGVHDFDETASLNNQSVLLHTGPWERYADAPDSLIDQLNLVLMGNSMSAAMRTILITYVTGIPSTQSAYRARRVVEAADLIINSPQYSVQR